MRGIRLSGDTVCVNIRMVDSSAKVNFWRFERVISREVDREKVDTTRIWRVPWSHYCRLFIIIRARERAACLPVEKIIASWASAAAGGRVSTKVLQFLVDALEGHVVVECGAVGLQD